MPRLANPMDYWGVPPERLQPNPPANRMRWVIKQYAQKPIVILGTLEAAFHLTGVDERVPTNIWIGSYSAGASPRVTAYAEEAIQKLPAYSRYDFVLPWMAAQLNKVALGVTVDPLISKFTRQGTAIAQWALANRVDLGRVSAEEALAAADEFRVSGPAEPGEIVYRFENGWTLQKLTTSSQLANEGEIMQQCVGNYYARVQTGDSVIYSLRDPQGHPHVTMEYSPRRWQFVQIRGKQNQPVVEKYRPYVWEVLLKVFDGEAVGLLLTGFDFAAHNMRISLIDANLQHAELGGMNLDDADLRNARLEDAWLVGASLVRANLRGADLRGANLRNADLTYADLRDANFDGAHLGGANFSGARADSRTLLPHHYLRQIMRGLPTEE